MVRFFLTRTESTRYGAVSTSRREGVMAKKRKKESVPTIATILHLDEHEGKLVSRAISDRIARLRSIAEQCSGDMYANIYSGEANELEDVLRRFV